MEFLYRWEQTLDTKTDNNITEILMILLLLVTDWKMEDFDIECI